MISHYKDAEVIIQNCHVDAGADNLWQGIWEMDDCGNITIFVERYFYDLCVKAKKSEFIKELLEHEYQEAKIALRLAKKAGFSGPISEIGTEFGGDAHELTVKEVDGFNDEMKYLNYLDKQLKIIGAKRTDASCKRCKR